MQFRLTKFGLLDPLDLGIDLMFAEVSRDPGKIDEGRRFDIRDLDAWIESKKIANQNEPSSKADLIDRLLTP